MGFEAGIGYLRFTCVIAAMIAVIPVVARAANPRLDKSTCEQLHAEQTKFIESGILKDLERGAEWGKTNLPAEKLREVEHYILLDEQIKFGCREESLTPAMLEAAEIAKRLELNSDADPFAPADKKPAKKSPAAEKKAKEPKSPAKPKPASATPEPKPERKSTAPTKEGWAAEIKTGKRKLPKEADETPPKTPRTRAVQELNWPPQLWPRPSATP